MWSWLTWPLRYSPARRIVLLVLGNVVRRKLRDTRSSLLSTSAEPADDADSDDGRRRWPWLVLLAGAGAGYALYRANARSDVDDIEWVRHDEPAVPAATPANGGAAVAPRGIADLDGVGAADAAVPSDDGAPVAADADEDAGPDLAAGAEAVGRPLARDELQVIEGIGPKIAQVLSDSGITTWSELADTDVDRLRALLDDAGPRYRMHDPTTWPDQAALLERGDWAAFSELTDSLRGGREV